MLMTKIRLFLFILVIVPVILTAQKIPLDHNVYDGWKSLSSAIISDDGKYVAYEINPQQGDGWLYICNIVTGQKDSVFCGTKATLSFDSRYVVYHIKPTYAETRKAKKDKAKEDMMPKNNMGISLLQGNSPLIVKRVKSFSLPESNSLWMAYLLEKKIEDKKDTMDPSDSTKVSKAPSPRGKKPPEPKGTELVIFNPVLNKEYRYNDVTEYVVSKDGMTISYLQVYPDTAKIDNFKVNIFDSRKETTAQVFEGKGSLKNLSASKPGDKLSFIFTQDTSKTKIYDLYLSRGIEKAAKIVDSPNPAMPSGWSVSENGNILFSDDGTRLFFGTAEKPVKEPEDTLLADEKYKLDIWSWDDEVLQPMQKKQLDQDQKRSYQAVYHIDKGVMFQLANKDIQTIRTIQKGNNDIALGSSNLKYQKESSWEGSSMSDYFIVNVKTGSKTLVLEKLDSRVSISPGGKYLAYWDTKDKVWVSLNISTGLKKVITASIKVPLYDELTDTPSDPPPHGIEGWMDDEKHVLIRDRYDIWLTDLTGTAVPQNITNGFGRKNNITFNYQKLDPDAEFIGKKELMYLTAFNNVNKEAGIYTLKAGTIGDPAKLV
ncbi:MAG: hypothetical protein C0408_07465, partial [Odoribacter sp.]|nr:hypothetical protein [Odoribacter sp.]